MRLEGIHHITAITADAVGNVEFYAGVLGLRMVKKTVNQDDPTVYHLFYGDEHGSPGADLTFFEYPGAARGRAGAGMVHRIVWRVSSRQALEFWMQRLGERDIAVQPTEGGLLFADPEGLEHELVQVASGEEPLMARAPDIPPEHALQGFDGVRAYASDPARSEHCWRRRSDSPTRVPVAGRCGVSGAAASTPTTPLRRTRTRGPAPAPSTTWLLRRSPRMRRPGASVCRRRAPIRRR